MTEKQYNCKHELKHTERLMRELPQEGKQSEHCIETWCADCGLYLNCVDI